MKREFVSLAPFFAFIERHGEISLRRAALISALGEESGRSTQEAHAVLSALAETRIAREGPYSLTYPCGEPGLGCEREVRNLGKAGERISKEWVAVCTHAPRICESAYVDADDIRELTLRLSEIARVIGECFRVTKVANPPSWARRKEGSKRPAEAPIVVGEQIDTEGRVRDILWLARPRPSDVETLLEAAERLARPSLVLVGTSASAPPDLRSRYAPGEHVELEVLSDRLVVEGKTVKLLPRLSVVSETKKPKRRAPVEETEAGEDAESKPAPAPDFDAIKLLPTAKRWKDVSITLVDGETISVRTGDRFRRLTYIDMGLATKGTRKPTKPWKLLVACCEGGGRFRWKAFGTFEAAKKLVSRLRMTMRAKFGIDDDPFETFDFEMQWRSKFRASAAFGENAP